MAEFSFRDSDHTYWLGEERLPSVTEIISNSPHGTTMDPEVPPEDFDGDSATWRKVLNRAAEIGSEVHKTIEEHHQEGQPLRSEDWSANKYLRGYKTFLGMVDFDVLGSEIPMYCDCHKFAGTVDLIVWHDNALKVWDIKTSSVLDEVSVSLQTAAYSHLFESNTSKTPDETGVVHLTKDGIGYKLKNVSNPEAFSTFAQALEDYRNDS